MTKPKDAPVRSAGVPGVLATPTKIEFAPVTVWAGIGAVFVAVYVYVMTRWVTGPAFRPVPTGPDVPPTWMSITAHTIEVITIVVFAWTFWAYVIRPWIREGGIPSDGLMVLALVTIYWQNTLSNYLSHITLLSSVFTNWGSWYGYVPGWMSPNMDRMPEAPIAWGLCFACWFVFFPMKAGAAITHRLRARYPGLRPGLIFGILLLGFMVLDVVLEGAFLRTGMYAYPGTVASLTLWAGKTYQIPLYEVVTWGSCWAIWAILYANRDDRGRMLVERKVDKLRVGSKAQKFVRFLALAGLFNLVFFVQNMVLVLFSVNADPWPEGYPSYLTNGICGAGTAYDCPTPQTPLPKQDTRTNRIAVN